MANQNSGIIHSQGKFYQKRGHHCPRKFGVTVLFLRYSLVMFHRKCTEHRPCSTGYQQICVYLITGDILPDGKGENWRFETALLRKGREWFTEPYILNLRYWTWIPFLLIIKISYPKNTTFRSAICLHKCKMKFSCVHGGHNWTRPSLVSLDKIEKPV